MSDRDFKAQAIESIARLGTVIAAFENEPINANLLQERFSKAAVYLLASIESAKPVVLDPRIKRLRRYPNEIPR